MGKAGSRHREPFILSARVNLLPDEPGSYNQLTVTIGSPFNAEVISKPLAPAA